MFLYLVKQYLSYHSYSRRFIGSSFKKEISYRRSRRQNLEHKQVRYTFELLIDSKSFDELPVAL
jgi:hypothetical protein